MSTRKPDKQEARARRLELEAALRERDRRKRRRTSVAGAAPALLVLAGGAAALGGGSHRTRPPAAVAQGELAPLVSLGRLNPAGTLGAVGPEDVPIAGGSELARGGSASGRSAIDGIRCEGAEQVLFHIHAHLTVFVNGAPRRIPYGVGILGRAGLAHPGRTLRGRR